MINGGAVISSGQCNHLEGNPWIQRINILCKMFSIAANARFSAKFLLNSIEVFLIVGLLKKVFKNFHNAIKRF